MHGTVIITGATGHLGLAFVEHLLASYPQHTLIATARSTAADNPNTNALRRVLARHPGSNAQIEQLDLSRLNSVRSFAARIASRVAGGQLPRVSALVCNAFAWSLGGQRATPDKLEETFQVCHLSHYMLVLRLIGSMDVERGRIVMLGSEAHDARNKNPFAKSSAGFPADIEELVRPPSDTPGEEHDRGFQRYGNAKLANVTFMLDLNERLQADPQLEKITATAMDPGGLVGSSAHAEQKAAARFIFGVMGVLMPVLRHVTTAVRTGEDSARDLVEVSVGAGFAGKRGYFTLQEACTPAAESLDLEARRSLWNACWRWADLSEGETVLENARP